MLLRIVDRLEEILIATMMAGATLIIFLSVVQRFAVGIPLLFPIASQFDMDWAQELCIFMFIWMAKFGAAYGVRTGIHVGVDVLIKRLEPSRRKWVVLFGLLCGALFTGVIGTMGAKFVYGLMGTDQTTPDLEWPSWMVYLCIPLGSYLMCFRFLQVAWAFARTGELPHHDAAHVEDLVGEDAEMGAPV
ncbi:C4-dicarboxylate ABC transporter substrate-binding protein [Aliidongia dinghuensis]|uniref:TRAP transporter small permease protein n=1 Tax=Aliidongia dinghuensis TaxID=1867774 RepID=A0A8J2YTW8_9PROT|nr:TRAP transporter small permease [Aliidongia dinghuensis]GGF14562.1 C4-dicarboxylate ABC transporter substrate-binding protein [Aliidongia dinghuensis]